MATEIASLYATVGADTSQLRREMQGAAQSLGDLAKNLDNTGGNLKQAERQSRSFADGWKTAKQTVLEFSGAAAIAGVTIKQAFEFGKAGAEIAQTEESFNRLGVSIEDLRRASNDTISDMTLMSSTLTLTAGASENLQQHLLDSTPRLLEIAKAANKLNPTLGDTAFMYESIAKGVKRAQPLILDNLGLNIKVGEANEFFAATVGKTVDELSAEEKQIALLNAVMIAGDRIIQQVGGSTVATTDHYAQLEAHIKNSVGDWKELANNGIQKAVEQLYIFANRVQLTERLWGDHTKAALAAGTAWETYAKQQYNALEAANGQEAVIGNIRSAMDDLGISTDEIFESTQNYNQAVETAIRLGIGLHETLSRIDFNAILLGQKAATQGYTDVGASLEHMIKVFNPKFGLPGPEVGPVQDKGIMAGYDDLMTAMDSGWGDSLRNFEQSHEDLTRTLADQRAELEELQKVHGNYVTVQNKSTWSAEELELKRRDLLRVTEQLNAAEVGSDDQLRLKIQYDDLAAAINNATGSTSYYIDKSKEISTVEGAIDGTIGKIEELEAAQRRQTGEMLLGFATMQAQADGIITQEELNYVAELGLAYGLLDQEGAIALGNLKTNMAGVTDGTLDAKYQVDILQRTISEMSGKTINIDVYTTYYSNQQYQQAILDAEKASQQAAWEAGQIPSSGSSEDIQRFATGGFLAAGSWGIVGEQGTELMHATGSGVEVIPLGGAMPGLPTMPMGGGRGSGGTGYGGPQSVSINIYDARDPHATASLVISELQKRGVVARNLLR